MTEKNLKDEETTLHKRCDKKMKICNLNKSVLTKLGAKS